MDTSSKDFPRFLELQDRLDNIGTAYDRYAVTVVTSWWPWCRDKMKWRHVPINIFCGQKAWGEFLRDWNSRAVLPSESDDMWAMIMYHEMNIARLYIGYKSMPSKKAQKMTLERMRNWYEKACFGSYIGGDDDVRAEVLKLLNLTYNVQANNYEEIAEMLCQR